MLPPRNIKTLSLEQLQNICAYYTVQMSHKAVRQAFFDAKKGQKLPQPIVKALLKWQEGKRSEEKEAQQPIFTWKVLSLIAQGCATNFEISEQLDISHNSTTGILTKLHNAGFVSVELTASRSRKYSIVHTSKMAAKPAYRRDRDRELECVYAVCCGNSTLKEIGNFMGLSHSQTSFILRKVTEQEAVFTTKGKENRLIFALNKSELPDNTTLTAIIKAIGDGYQTTDSICEKLKLSRSQTVKLLRGLHEDNRITRTKHQISKTSWCYQYSVRKQVAA